MKKNILYNLVLLVYLSLTLNAAALDLDIVDVNKSVLETLAKQIQEHKKANEDITLQRILLEKIKSFDVHYNSDEILPKTIIKQKEYENLFKSYIANLKDMIHLKKVLKNTENMLELLKSKIQKSTASENSILTLKLQYIYYKKQIEFYKNKIEALQNIINTQKALISDNIMTLKFDNKSINDKLNTLSVSEQKINNLITKLKLKLEEYQLLEDIKNINKTVNILTQKQEYQQTILKRKLIQQFLKLSMLLQNKDKKVFQVQETIKSTINKMSISNEFKDNLLDFMHSIVLKYMGVIKTITASTSQSLSTSFTSVFNSLNTPIFSINEVQISSIKLIIAFLIFLLGFFIGNVYKRYVKHFSSKSISMSSSTRTLLSNLGYYLIIVIAFFISLNMLGINLSSITLVAGALSVGIGFGLQNIVSNFVSGIILMFEKSVKVDDYVELSDSLRGKIIDIRMRSTVISTNANIDVIVPNQNFIQNNVVNWTMNDNIKRFEIQFGVAYGSDINEVIKIVTDAVNNSGFKDLYITEDRYTRVLMVGMGDSSVNFELLVWIKGKEILYPKRTTSRFLILVYNALYEHNISIPFPQLDLHVKKD